MSILLRVYFDAGWWAEYLVGCDVERVSITFSEALWLETLL